MKSIATNVMPPIQVIGQGVKENVLRDRLMERGVEDRHLRKGWAKNLARRENSFDIIGVVQGGQVNARLDSLKYVVVNQSGLSEQFSTVNYPMSYRMNVSWRPHLRYF